VCSRPLQPRTRGYLTIYLMSLLWSNWNQFPSPGFRVICRVRDQPSTLADCWRAKADCHCGCRHNEMY